MDVFLRDAQDADSRSRGITARVQIGTRNVVDNSGSNGIFTRSPARITSAQPIYIDYDLTLLIAMAIGAMGAAVKRGCAEAANAAAARVKQKLIGVAHREMTCGTYEADQVTSITRTATESGPAAAVTVNEKPIPLNRFSPVFETPTGVSAITRRSRGPDQYAAAFIAGGNDGSDTVFRREGHARYPIDELYGPSVAQVINSELPGQRQAIETILYLELRNAADRIVNENFGYDAIGGAENFITSIA